ncbi:hypothetical protein R1sor_021939 [Riccia sorocarpa]|uniref:Uncharacterized protein n=1 Tax=Riccia sorocarpa TaxID=122646 RepID=A0ABD3GJ59_9MARC
MIAVGSDFWIHGDSRSGNQMIPASSDGFIDEWRFQSLLRLTLHRMKGEGIGRMLLEDLPQRLNLRYRFEDGANSGASVSEGTSRDDLQISEELKPLADFVGAKSDQIDVKIDVIERKIDRTAEVMYSSKAELQHLKTGMLEMQKVMTDVSSSIDKLIGYSLEVDRLLHFKRVTNQLSRKDAGVLPKGKVLHKGKAYVL